MSTPKFVTPSKSGENSQKPDRTGLSEKDRISDCIKMGVKKLEKSDWSRWYVVPEKQGDSIIMVVRRYRMVDGRTQWKRYPRREYRDLKPAEIRGFVSRLNRETDADLVLAKRAYEVKHEYITQDILDAWETEVIDSQSDARLSDAIIRNVKKHFLHFFIEVLELTDPIQWYEHQKEWRSFFLNKRPSAVSKAKWDEFRFMQEGAIWSQKYIKDQVMFANRFVVFLHRKNPRVFPLLKFDPIAKAVLKKHEADRVLDKRIKLKWYVTDDQWSLINKGDPKRGLSPVDSQVLPFIKLAYHLGLRDSECLGVRLDDVGELFFELRRQLVAIPEGVPEFGPPKSRKPREIFYWGTSAAEIYEIIENLPVLCHPNTLVHRVSSEMKRLGLNGRTMHDFRRSWITRSLHAGANLLKVRDSAGHAQLSTTNLYLVDIGSTANKRYKPPVK
jgi:integrase